MQFVKTNDLKPGMRLAKPIYNKMGVMLYERDTKLNKQGIESIRNFDLIGIYILEPAEPAPPLSKEDIAFERFQTMSMFQLRTCMDLISNEKEPKGLHDLVNKIILNYGSLNHKLNFTQNIRSSGDFTYKHSISTAILTAMITHVLGANYEMQKSCVTAALLFDIGYLFVPPEILSKGNNINESEQKTIQECRKIGFARLNPDGAPFLEPNVLNIISQIIHVTDPTGKAEKITLLNGTKILRVADKFDRLTAMSLEREPVSEITAIRHLIDHPEIYDEKVVSALSSSIHILPPGSSVELTTNEKAMVLMDNPDNFMQPLILTFHDNRVYDLRDPSVYARVQIRDIMKTMDNRIAIDEETLKQFYADENIKKIADKFRKKKEQIRQRQQS